MRRGDASAPRSAKKMLVGEKAEWTNCPNCELATLLTGRSKFGWLNKLQNFEGVRLSNAQAAAFESNAKMICESC